MGFDLVSPILLCILQLMLQYAYVIIYAPAKRIKHWIWSPFSPASPSNLPSIFLSSTLYLPHTDSNIISHSVVISPPFFAFWMCQFLILAGIPAILTKEFHSFLQFSTQMLRQYLQIGQVCFLLQHSHHYNIFHSMVYYHVLEKFHSISQKQFHVYFIIC